MIGTRKHGTAQMQWQTPSCLSAMQVNEGVYQTWIQEVSVRVTHRVYLHALCVVNVRGNLLPACPRLLLL